MAILFHCTHESIETPRAPLAERLPGMPLRDSADMDPAGTPPGPACDQIVDAIGRPERGETPPHVIDRQAGY